MLQQCCGCVHPYAAMMFARQLQDESTSVQALLIAISGVSLRDPCLWAVLAAPGRRFSMLQPPPTLDCSPSTAWV